MLFNSHAFILIFLPFTLIGYFALARMAPQVVSRLWLIAMSFVFYGWWSWTYAAMLLGLIIFVYLSGKLIGHLQRTSKMASRAAAGLAIAGILGVLAYFKYAGFFTANLAALTGGAVGALDIILPLAISFYVFQMIAYLGDCVSDGEPGYSFAEFALFILFFPQLIAGPIVHHSEVVPQYKSTAINRFDPVMFGEGVGFFVIGLMKKLLIADFVTDLATPVFVNAVDSPPGLLLAWVAAIAFGIGLYFDFSGYSDMAVGLARMFGIRLPYNFNSPYQATSIIDFWRRWHITLSRFLRDYLYIPLGGNRLGPTRRSLNLMATMLLGGLWHGAGWTFVIWGALHGAYLLVNHLWNARLGGVRLGAPMSQTLTLIAVTAAWVFFASPSTGAALEVLGGMAGLNGVGALAGPDFPTPRRLYLLLAVLGLGIGVALFAPNAQALIDERRPLIRLGKWTLDLQPSTATGLAAGAAFIFAMVLMVEVKEFVYFQF